MKDNKLSEAAAAMGRKGGAASKGTEKAKIRASKASRARKNFRGRYSKPKDGGH